LGADHWFTARQAVAGLFLGLLAGAIVSWIALSILAAALPRSAVAPAGRHGCAIGAPGRFHRAFPGAPGGSGCPGMAPAKPRPPAG